MQIDIANSDLMDSPPVEDIPNLPVRSDKQNQVRYLTRKRFKKPRASFLTVKKYHVNLKPVQRTRKWPVKLLFLVSMCIPILIYHSVPNCCDLAVEESKEALEKHVFGQHKAIQRLMEVFKQDAQKKLTYVLGDTGVGKTYALSRLLDPLKNCSNIYYTTPTSFYKDLRFSKLFMTSLFCKKSLVIVDGLTIDDSTIYQNVKELFMKKTFYSLHVVLVFNTNFNNLRLKEANMNISEALNYDLIDAEKTVIEFEKLTNDSLIKCIDFNLKYYSKRLYYEPEALLKYFDVSRDGCKGVNSKIKGLKHF